MDMVAMVVSWLSLARGVGLYQKTAAKRATCSQRKYKLEGLLVRGEVGG